MAAKAKKSYVGPTVFRAPHAEVGDTVHFWLQKYDPNVAPDMAVVTAVGEDGRTVNVAVLPPDFSGFKLMATDVRHADDPDNARLRQEEEDEFGVWRHRPNYVSTAEALRLRKLLSIYERELNEALAAAPAGPDDDDAGDDADGDE